ncbi:unnamed protein product, partial [Rotaria magnacalcarata]
MKDTKTVLPTVNGGGVGGNGANKNGFHHKNKTQENGNNDDNELSTVTMPLKHGLDDNEELVGGCCVCSDDQGFANNALVYCDGKGCTVACHTACYGIVTIPDGNWYCGRCEANDIRAPCRLCPTTEGAMKRTSDGDWAHVVCALYIPEVSFGDDATMEPIILSKIPSPRYGQECSICVQNGRSKLIATSGACCGCTVKNCLQVFHVTCAQANGLLCEDVRKNNCQYPIYCEQHRPKLSKFIRQIQAFQYSPNALVSMEQIKRQHLYLKEKESPSQLSDFVAAAAAEAAASEPTLPSSSTLSLDDTYNQTTTSDEQQTPFSFKIVLFYNAILFNREKTTNDTKSSNSNHGHQSALNTVEGKSSVSRSSTLSLNDNINNKSSTKERHSTDGVSTSIKFNSIRKPITTTKIKDDDNDEDFELNKKRKFSIKLNKDGQPRKKRLNSVESAPRPVGRPPSKKTILAQQFTNGVKRPFPKPTMSNNNHNMNMKQQKVNDASININKISTEPETDNEIQLNSRSTHYYPCDHFGNQINSDALKQHGHSDEQLQQISPSDTTEETPRTRVPSSSTTRIEFYPRRPLQSTSTQSTTTDQQQQRTFPPQTLEEFLEQEWELSSDFLLQQTMPHDVSSLLSCLYQFKSENASLQKKFEELRHRRDSLRVTNANLRRRLTEILPINDTVSPPSTAATPTTTVSQVSPPTLPPPPPPPLPPPPPPSHPHPVLPATVLSVVPPSPRKEQQQLKQQKLLAELELQQHLQQQKAISPSRRRLSTNTNHQYTDSCQPTIKKSKSPRQTNSLAHQSILENQLRQSSITTTTTTTT